MISSSGEKMDCGINNADNSDVPRGLWIVFNRPLYVPTYMASSNWYCRFGLIIRGNN